jgi:hypothetical protein
VTYFNLYRVSAILLGLSTLGHTLGGMLGTARKGPQAGPEADQVFSSMKSVRFRWNGADSSWYGFWMGNGLSVTALLVLAVAVLWILGGLSPDAAQSMLPLAWAAFASLSLLGVVALRYFGAMVGGGFVLIAVLSGIAAVRSTFA